MMQRRTPALFATFALTVIAAHFATLYTTPGFIMDRVEARLTALGTPQHTFRLAPRMTPQTQTVVRPSPDLAYSICLYDLTAAPEGLLVTMAAFDDYASLSFFDARTDNFATVRGTGQDATVALMPPGSVADGEDEIAAPTQRGLVLIRRLAPTREAYDEVVAAADRDRCAVR